MLNYALYKKLEELVGEDQVEIVRENNPGCIVSGDVKNRFRVHGGEQYMIRCPVCEDTHKKRLGFSYLCGQRAKIPSYKKVVAFSPYMYRCFHKECQRYPELRKWVKYSGILDMDIVDLKDQEVNLQKKKMFELYKTEDMKLPKKVKPLMSPEVPDVVIDYIHERGFSPDYLSQDFGIMYASKGVSFYNSNTQEMEEFGEDKLIIPVSGRRRLKGWQARSIHPNSLLRYYTCPGSEFADLLYNMDNAKYYSGCGVVEGAADVWKINQLKDYGISGVGLLSKGMNTERIKILLRLWGFIHNWGFIMLDSEQKDPDAPKKAEDISKKCIDNKIFPNGLAVVNLPYGDPGDFSPEELLEFIQDGEVKQ